MRRVVTARTPTSSAGSDVGRGFTLLELLVVLGLAALFMAVVPSRLDALVQAVRYRNAVQGALQALETTRIRSMASGQRAEMVVDAERRQLMVDAHSVLALPQDIAVEVRGVSDPSGGAARIYFDPDGSASGGVIRLSAGARSTRIAVDWLTGRIDVEAAAP